MKVLIIGKRPPLQGGTAIQTWRFARDCVQSGHRVSYLSNAGDAGSNYRMLMTEHDQQYFDKLSQGIKFVDCEPLPYGAFIPFSSSVETRLLGSGLDLVDDSDIIVGWYLQPFGVVSSILARCHGKRSVLVHAGSDIGRLALHPQLRRAYEHAISGSQLITHSPTTQKIVAQLLGHTIESRVSILSRGRRLDPWFTRRGNIFDFASYALPRGGWYTEFPSILKTLQQCPQAPERNSFVITMYGKVGASKGTFHLLRAVRELLTQGRKVTLVLTLGGHVRAMGAITDFLNDNPEVGRNFVALPFLAPWNVANLIRSSDLVCFLESGFEIAFHSPNVPREVLSVGQPLLMSGEIWRKYNRFLAIDPSVHAAVIEDPSNVAELATQIAELMDNNLARTRIGIAGLSASRGHEVSLPNCDPLVDHLNTLLN